MSPTDLFLLARVGGERVALPASAIGSVMEVGTVTPVPRAPDHVVGLCALRSRVLTVVDARAALGLGHVAPADRLAVVVEQGGHGYALLLDAVEDAVPAEARACPAALSSCWATAARGAIEHDGQLILLVDPAALIEGVAAAANR